jgi:hypothetical protein
MMSADIDDRLASSKRRAALGCLAVAVVGRGPRLVALAAIAVAVAPAVVLVAAAFAQPNALGD